MPMVHLDIDLAMELSHHQSVHRYALIMFTLSSNVRTKNLFFSIEKEVCCIS